MFKVLPAYNIFTYCICSLLLAVIRRTLWRALVFAWTQIPYIPQARRHLHGLCKLVSSLHIIIHRDVVHGESCMPECGTCKSLCSSKDYILQCYFASISRSSYFCNVFILVWVYYFFGSMSELWSMLNQMSISATSCVRDVPLAKMQY